MHGLLAGITRFVAIVFSIVFTLTATVVILVANINPHLLNPTAYINALATQQVYAKLPQIIIEQLVAAINYDPCQSDPLSCAGKSPEFISCARAALGDTRYETLSLNPVRLTEADKLHLEVCLNHYGASLQSQPGGQNPLGDLAPFVRVLGVANLKVMLSQLMPADELQSMTEDTVNQVFAYVNGQQDTAAISLVDLKQRISSPAGMDSLLGIIRDQPPCTLQQIEQLAASLLDSQPGIVLCNPSGQMLTLLGGILQSQLDAVAREIPDQVVILSPTTGENPALPGGGLIGTIRLVQLILRFAAIIPLFFLLIITLLVIRSPKSWLRWWGIPFFITGLLAFGIALSVSIFFEQAWQSLLVTRLPPILSDSVVALAHDLLRAILQPYLGGVFLDAFLIGLPGLGMWIGSAFIQRKGRLTQ
jgi:hypothetical protein